MSEFENVYPLRDLSKKIINTNRGIDDFIFSSQVDLLHLILKNYLIDNKYKAIEIEVIDYFFIEKLFDYTMNIKSKNKLESILSDNKNDFQGLWLMSSELLNKIFDEMMVTIRLIEQGSDNK